MIQVVVRILVFLVRFSSFSSGLIIAYNIIYKYDERFFVYRPKYQKNITKHKGRRGAYDAGVYDLT